MSVSTKEASFADEWILPVLKSKLGVTEDDLALLRRRGVRFAVAELIRSGRFTREQASAALNESYGFGWVEPTRDDVDRLALKQIGEEMCRRHLLIPLKMTEDTIDLAAARPLDATALEDVRVRTGRTPRPRYTPAPMLHELIEVLFDPDDAVYDLLKNIEAHDTVELVRSDNISADGEVRAPVVRLMNSLIARAIASGASDVHIEHSEHSSVVRFRVDGDLSNIMTLPRSIAAGPLLARLKIMGDLDIANRMRPQDGRIALRVGSNEFDLRLSTLPTQYGEKAVLRILDHRTASKTLKDLGFDPPSIAGLAAISESDDGVFIMTGPTGSGKTTTLMSMLGMMRSTKTNIVTIENPVEYRLEGVSQVNVNEAQGLGFPQILRSVLRQDPDTIMVGEIRDKETAAIASQAAQTGHLVLTTLHANDSVKAIVRLMDMGLEPFAVAAGLRATSAQRLVRRLCRACRKPADDGASFLAVGCADCRFTGYSGRVALLEILQLNDDLRGLVANWPGEKEFRQAAAACGALRTLADAAKASVAAGDTSAEEVASYWDGARSVPSVRAAVPRGEDRVLIVDDDEVLRLLLVRAVVNRGMAADEAENGEVALELLRRKEYAAVLTDLNMPRVDGRALLSRIRSDPRTAGVPVLILTSDTDDHSHEMALEAGADDYLTKPFKPAIVAAKLAAAVRRAAGEAKS